MRQRPASVDDLKKKIEARHPGETRLPSDRSLALELGADRRTVARAVAQLAEAGRVQIEGRVRTFRPFQDPPQIGLCLDNSVTDKDARNASGTGRLLIARGLMKRIARSAPPLSMQWCDMQDPGPGRFVPSLDSLSERGVGALAIWPTLPLDEGSLARLRAIRDRMPLVLLDRRVPGLESDFAGFDDEDAGRQIALHALGLGHSRIAFYGWAVPETVHSRRRGVEAVLSEAGGPSLHSVLVPHDVETGQPFARLLDSRQDPTAVICANDFSAIALLAWLGEQGISVPGDIAVFAIGNSFESVHEPLGLTTVAFSQEEVGAMAADIILARLQGGAPLSGVVERRTPGRLIVRRSCGSLPQSPSRANP